MDELSSTQAVRELDKPNVELMQVLSKPMAQVDAQALSKTEPCFQKSSGHTLFVNSGDNKRQKINGSIVEAKKEVQAALVKK